MQTFFTNFLKENKPKETEAYELKITSGTSIPFDMVKDHQVKGLLDSEAKGLYHKITDQPWIQDRPYSFTKPKPFDCFCIVNAKAFVVVWFYKPRKPKKFIKIRIKDFLDLKDNCGRKSFTEEMALAIDSKILNIS